MDDRKTITARNLVEAFKAGLQILPPNEWLGARPDLHFSSDTVALLCHRLATGLRLVEEAGTWLEQIALHEADPANVPMPQLVRRVGGDLEILPPPKPVRPLDQLLGVRWGDTTEEERATLPVGTQVWFENKTFPSLSYACFRLGPSRWDSHEIDECEGADPWSDDMVEEDARIAEFPPSKEAEMGFVAERYDEE